MMEDWFSQLEKALIQAADDTEQFLNTTVDQMLEASDAIVDSLETQVGKALDTLDQVVEPLATSLTSSIETWVEDVTAPVNQVVEPWLQDHPRCIGCRHYHGQFYGGDMLICAMHPYGPEDDMEKCPDWESTWWSSS